MLPGHTRIPGHSGTDFKHRNPYKKLKRLNKIFLFKYGDLDGGKNHWIDEERIGEAVKRKKAKMLTNVLGLIILFLVGIIFCVKIIYFLELPYPKNHYGGSKLITHGTEIVELDLKNKALLKKGYQYWSEGDIENAIIWLEKVDDFSERWRRKEYALMGIYGQTCKWQQKNCQMYDLYKNIVRINLKAKKRNLKYSAFHENVKTYNLKMFAHFQYDIPENYQ